MTFQEHRPTTKNAALTGHRGAAAARAAQSPGTIPCAAHERGPWCVGRWIMCFPWGMVQNHENQNMKLSLAQEICFFLNHISKLETEKSLSPGNQTCNTLQQWKFPRLNINQISLLVSFPEDFHQNLIRSLRAIAKKYPLWKAT
jgi:hypothetical protein